MTRILANENFPRMAVEALRQNGYDVVWVRTDSPGSSDETVLERAGQERRLLVTFDKDFGELAFRRGLSATCGVVLFRIPPLSPEYTCSVVVETVESRADWRGCFAVVEPGRTRIRDGMEAQWPLPSDAKDS